MQSQDENEEDYMDTNDSFKFRNIVSKLLNYVNKDPNLSLWIILLFSVTLYVLYKWNASRTDKSKRNGVAEKSNSKKSDVPNAYDEKLLQARLKMQEEYSLRVEKMKEEEEAKKREMKENSLNNKNKKTEDNDNNSGRRLRPRIDYNPLSGGNGVLPSYRPPRRSGCSGGRCG